MSPGGEANVGHPVANRSRKVRWGVVAVVATIIWGCADVPPADQAPRRPAAPPSPELAAVRGAPAAAQLPAWTDRREEATTPQDVSGWSGPGPRRAILFPTRVALSPGHQLFVTDARLGAVFVYDADLEPIGEIGGLDVPLGVAASADRIFVGSDGDDAVLIHDMTGRLVGMIHDIPMPNDLALASDGRLFVADSGERRVRVYDACGAHQRDIPVGDGGAAFPAAIAVLPGDDGIELAVADQVGKEVLLYDSEGTEVGRLGGPATNDECEGLFIRPQGLAVAGDGSLHVLDGYTGRVQVFAPLEGTYRGSYGGWGAGAGGLGLALDLIIDEDGRAVVTDAGDGRLEVLHASR